MYQFLLFLLLISCTHSTYRAIEKYESHDMVTTRLGESPFLLKHPVNMFLEEARGKEGQLGYGLWLNDSITRFSGIHGFIEIEHGKGIESAENDGPAIEVVKTIVLNKLALWPVSKTETGYYTSFMKIGGLRFSASASRLSALDSVIAILSTLTKN